MRKTIIGLAVLAALVSSASAQNWFKGTFDEAQAKAKAENKMLLVNFFSGG
jgi:hypothetical protein